MALNLSTLTSSATSGDVLAEALTTADFLENVPVLRNLARGSQKGGDAKQDVALNQPRSLPLIKNPAGNLGGYLYIPNASGNYATGQGVTIGANQTWEAEVDMVITQFGNYVRPLGGGDWTDGFGLLISATQMFIFSKTASGVNGNILGITLGTPFNLKYGFDGNYLYAEVDGTRANITQPSNQSSAIYRVLELNQQTLNHVGNYAIQKAKLTVNSAVVFDCDFNGSTSIRHGDTKFQAAVGGPVVLNQSGNDPATVIKKSVLRFDGTDDGLRGLFANNINSGYMFAAFSVLGDGGEAYGRIFGANINGGFDYQNTGFALRRLDSTETLNLRYSGGSADTHQNLFDDDRGDLLLESRLSPGSQKSKVNDADANNGVTTLADNGVAATRYSISSNSTGDSNLAIDLEFLALFPSSITDAQADSVRNYINNRNNVFDLKDGFGYYFYDATKAPVGAITTGSSSWNGRIVGSDLGDSDRYLTQGTTNDAPVGDGFKVTFADNTDHLEIPQVTQAGWQVVGTSLGTFAYRVDNDAVTELNLLGNAGHAGWRLPGELYGIMLLPETATTADVNNAKKLLLDRGANEPAEGAGAIYYGAWYQRRDIVEFQPQTFPNAVNMGYAWSTNLSLNSFGAIQAPLCTNFSNAWQNCPSLTSFPAGAKLGTSASSVNFQSAWESSGLTSFPSLDLSKGSNFVNAWKLTTSLTSFSADAQIGTETSNVNIQSAWESSGLTSFNTPLPTVLYAAYAWYNCTSLESFSSELSLVTSAFQSWFGCSSLSDFKTTDIKNCNNFASAWKFCTSLTSFPSDALLGTSANNVNFSGAWWDSGLTSFSTPLPTAGDCFAAFYNSDLETFNTSLPSATNLSHTWGNCSSLSDFSANVFDNWNPSSIGVTVFNNAWVNCTSLTAQSVENILVSIAASGKYATTTGASGGSALADAGIDIDYNVSTGSLSAAANTAVTSLKSKGWSIIVNNVTL